jgi:hypothetical protein
VIDEEDAEMKPHMRSSICIRGSLWWMCPPQTRLITSPKLVYTTEDTIDERHSSGSLFPHITRSPASPRPHQFSSRLVRSNS